MGLSHAWRKFAGNPKINQHYKVGMFAANDVVRFHIPMQ
jgi:hypothetical protein